MKKYFKYLVVILLLFVYFLFIRQKTKQENYNLNKRTKFTVATITSDFHYRQTTKGAGTDYKYNVRNIIFDSGSSTGTFIKGDKYLIAFDSLHPNNNKIFQINVTDSIYIYPKNGWKVKDIPFKIDTTALKKELTKW